MISCICATARGTETQSDSIELSDPLARMFLFRHEDRACNALRAWLAQQSESSRLAHVRAD
jgi:hypothetical protein